MAHRPRMRRTDSGGSRFPVSTDRREPFTKSDILPA